MRIRITCLLSLLLPLTLACSDDGPADPGAQGNVSLDAGQAVSQSIGLSGGTLSTTASDGTAYTLEIPVGALAAPTTITLTPVRGIAGLPVLDSLSAGLDLQPAGLVFATPARLTIAGAGTPGVGEVPIAVGYEGDADHFTLGFAAASGDEIIVLINHFSGFGLDFGTEEDMSALITGLPATPQSQLYANELLLAFNDDPTATVLHENIMREWFTVAILPTIVGAGNDGELLTALSDFLFWMVEVPAVLGLGFDVPAALAAEIDAAREAFLPLLQEAVAANNALCEQGHSLDALRNVLFWQKQAGALSLDTPANSLDEASVRESLCAEVVIEGASLPENLQVGYPHSLDFRLLLKFSDGSTLAMPFVVSITAINATIQNQSGLTDPFGNYTTVVTAASNEAVQVFITGNAILPGETLATLIEGTFVVSTAAGVDLTGSYIGGLAGGITVLEVTQNQNAVSGSFEIRHPSFAHAGTFVGTLAGNEILGISLELDDGCGFTPDGLMHGDYFVTDGRTTIRIVTDGFLDCHGHSLGTIQGCGPNSVLNELDFSGEYDAVFNCFGHYHYATATISGGFGVLSGTFVGGRNGSFSAHLAEAPMEDGCVLGVLSNIQMQFTDCDIPGNTGEFFGCASISWGRISLNLLSLGSGIYCDGYQLSGVDFTKQQTTLCTGD